jgi:hypothetical protein
MRLGPRKRSRQALAISVMLVTFALRALIPAGYMPASDRLFSLQICWEGYPAGLLAHAESARADSMAMDSGMEGMPADSMPAQGAHHHHPGIPSGNEHCVFGTACSAGPIFHLPVLGAISPSRQLFARASVSIAGAVNLVHLPQPRAPPGRLS